MGRYLIGRLTGAAIALLGVSTLAFFATALAPGNPAAVLLGTMATPERVAVVSKQLGLDKPLPFRYVRWLEEAILGNLGTSNINLKPVTSLLADALPITLELAAISLFLAVLTGMPAGLFLAQRNDRRWARPVLACITLGVSVPGFWVGLMLIIFFAVGLGVLPSGGYMPVTEGLVLNLKHMALPALTLSIYLTPALVRFVRVTALRILREDYIKTARSKGISGNRILLYHVAPNTLIPTLTYIGLQLGVLVSGAIVIEVVFALPGLGRLGLNAVLNRDYPVIQGVVLVVASGYVIANLLVDLAYGFVDPRVRLR